MTENPVFITCEESFLRKETARRKWIHHKKNSFQHQERVSADSLNFWSSRDFIGTLKYSDIIHEEVHRGISLAMGSTLKVIEIVSF